VKKVKATVGQDDLLAGCAPLSGEFYQVEKPENFLGRQRQSALHHCAE
jgi:hypothetical protein